MYRTLNNKIIIKQINLSTQLGNGIVIQETRGKKDILVGEVIISSTTDIKEGDLVWFPEYAALPITLNNKSYNVIDYSDIILTKEKEKE